LRGFKFDSEKTMSTNHSNGLARTNSVRPNVPREPHTAATEANTEHKQKKIESTKSVDSCLAVHLNKDNLIRYKIRTNLEKFNSKRPGVEFSESDFKHVEEKASESPNEQLVKNSIENAKRNLSTKLAQDLVKDLNRDLVTTQKSVPDLSTQTLVASNKLLPSFVDARFYTDAQFLKLANQLKKSSLEPNKKQTRRPNDRTAGGVESAASETSSNVDGKEQYEARIDYLENQMKGIYEQLQVQTQVNVELKKMLVASISGEDLQYKLERLVSDKQRYEIELANNRKEIQRLNEEIEQISIQCDLWRTKFSASKLLSEENFAWYSYYET
jgi:hypothetical protein